MARTEKTKNAWKINIPKLYISDSKSEILSLLPDEIDYLSELEMFWGVNEIINKYADITHFPIPKDDVFKFKFDDIISFFERLRITK